MKHCPVSSRLVPLRRSNIKKLQKKSQQPLLVLPLFAVVTIYLKALLKICNNITYNKSFLKEIAKINAITLQQYIATFFNNI